VNLHELVSQLIRDTKARRPRESSGFRRTPASAVFLPELVLCATIVLMLLVRVFSWGRARR